MLLFALALLLAGVLLGSRGMRGLGRIVRGPWRPGAGVLGVLAAFMALALAARTDWLLALAALAVSAAALTGARLRGRPAAMAPSPRMSRREAETLLGLPPEAKAEEVEAAYRRLMRRAHPDAGGTAGLAAQVNLARATLLER